jgi:hypothetical protein
MGVVQRDFVSEEKLPALLERMLAPIRRSRDTPLQFDIDSLRIVEAALQDFLPGGLDSTRAPDLDWESLISALNMLIDTILLPEKSDPSVEPAPHGSEQAIRANEGAAGEEADLSPHQNFSHPLAAWLDSLFTVLRNVDNRSFEILSLRLEGFQDRDISEKLGTGLRLVKRITREMRFNWKEEAARG